MTEPTWKHQAFIAKMKQSPEHAQWGFEILLKRADFATFFGSLRASGLFDPSNNPAPVPVQEGRFVRVPYWAALDYLIACAKRADHENDVALARDVIAVVREVSLAQRARNGEPNNYHTHRAFAEVVGLLPLAVIEPADIDLVPDWLNSPFDRGSVAHELDIGLMTKLLASESHQHWSSACRVAKHCTAIRWVDEEGFENKRKKPISVVDDHWLREFLTHHARRLGETTRSESSDLFLQRVRDVYSIGVRAGASYLFRPAIEEHPQNHEWAGVDNRVVEALRDCLLGWLDTAAGEARSYIDNLVRDETQIVRRIAIYLLNERWTALRALYAKNLDQSLFDLNHRHELYSLLRDRFPSFAQDERIATLEVLRNLQAKPEWRDPDVTLRGIQRDWLSSIAQYDFEPVKKWYAELESDTRIGSLSEHPDFLSFMESWSGPGPTPFRAEELVEFAKDRSVVERLNEFSPKNDWRGPTKRALVDALEEAVTIAPTDFMSALPLFLGAQRPYQYGVISGFKKILDDAKVRPADFRAEVIWPTLFDFFGSLISDAQFWSESVSEDRDLTPTRDWIPPLISEVLRAGTKSDEDAHDASLLPRAWALIQILLSNSKQEDQASDDAMTQAINSPKGKAIEALFSHVLRRCRLADAGHEGSHAQEWAEVQPTMDAELAKCHGSNFEFSTLAAAYLQNVEYMSQSWLRANIDKLFPIAHVENLSCAVQGLAYAGATRAIYRLLSETGVLDRLLTMESREANARERLAERVALAYLWGDEELSSTRFRRLFDTEQIEDLETIATFFWSVSNQALATDQIQRVLAFFGSTVDWARTRPAAPTSLLAKLSRLTIYLSDINDVQAAWLDYVAPYVQEGHNGYEFVEQLDKLASRAPQVVSTVLRKVLDAYRPTYDYRDVLKSLIRTLSRAGRRTDAIEHADRLRYLPGMHDLYVELTEGVGPAR